MLFARTISPMIRPVDGLAEGRHDKTRLKTRRQRHSRAKNKTEFLRPAGWAKDDTRDQMEGSDEGFVKTIVILRSKQNKRSQKQNEIGTKGDAADAEWQRTGGYRRHGREPGNTANKEQRL